MQQIIVAHLYTKINKYLFNQNFGNHQIDLTVEDVQGLKSTFTHKFTQADDLYSLEPFVDFTAVQSGARTVFLDLNRSFDFDRDQNIKSYQIDYGNGQTEDTTDLYATHTYPVAGNYQITIKAISAHYTEKSVTRSIRIAPLLSVTSFTTGLTTCEVRGALLAVHVAPLQE
jgi:PKD repeat protein